MNIKTDKSGYSRLLPERGGWLEIDRSKYHVHCTLQEDLRDIEDEGERSLQDVFGSKKLLLTSEEAQWLVKQLNVQIEELEKVE